MVRQAQYISCPQAFSFRGKRICPRLIILIFCNERLIFFVFCLPFLCHVRLEYIAILGIGNGGFQILCQGALAKLGGNFFSDAYCTGHIYGVHSDLRHGSIAFLPQCLYTG